MECRNPQKASVSHGGVLENHNLLFMLGEPVIIGEGDLRTGKIHVLIPATKLSNKMHNALETLASEIPCLSEASILRRLGSEATVKFSGASAGRTG